MLLIATSKPSKIRGRMEEGTKGRVHAHWQICSLSYRSSAGRAGRPVIGRLVVQIPALGRAELHVEVSLSEILNPT